jgi:glycosyltransferase involved in cell wall biosynthesis
VNLHLHRRFATRGEPRGLRIALLTGGQDLSYALGLTDALARSKVRIDVVGSNSVDHPYFHTCREVAFLNLRGDQRENASFPRKATRLSLYYLRLLHLALAAPAPVFHILWNNKFETIDRTVLMAWYRLLGRKVVLTAHNVNAARRDGKDGRINRLTLKIQYALSHHLFVHTEAMQRELAEEFKVNPAKTSVIPFGLNDSTPKSQVTGADARRTLGISGESKVAAFFGQIAPYKGLHYLIDALPEIVRRYPDFRLIIAGKIKRGAEEYWSSVERSIAASGVRSCIVARIEHVPDAEVEIYFKAADLLVIPYTSIYQSGVPFLAYSFGLPVVATDVGSLRDDVVDGKTGLICQPRDAPALAATVIRYFESDMYKHLPDSRRAIRVAAVERYSWDKVAETTVEVYRTLLEVGHATWTSHLHGGAPNGDSGVQGRS